MTRRSTLAIRSAVMAAACLSIALAGTSAGAVEVNLTDRIVMDGMYNLWRVTVRNPNSYTVRCMILGTYRYADPNGTGRLIWDQTTRSVTVPPGGTGYADYGLTDRNIQADDYKVLSCNQI